MSATFTWFGPTDSPVAGWLHLSKDAEARGGVVLCPSLGIEMMVAQPAYRDLADSLARMGFVVCRFDYPGTGDSAGTMDADSLLAQWHASVDEAIALVTSTGVTRLALVGLRTGAAMAVAAAGRHASVTTLVAWDPIGGRHFLREQQALQAFGIGSSEQDSDNTDLLDLPAFALPRRLAAELKTLALRGEPHHLERSLVLERPDGYASDALFTWLEPSEVDRLALVGQEAFLDVPAGESLVPDATIAEIGEWLDKAVDATPITVRSKGRRSAVVARDAKNHPVVERGIEVGPHKLFGVLTKPAEPQSSAPVLLLNIGLLHHIGPGNLWVDLARKWAAEGHTVLRFDLGGIGDSPARPGAVPRISYPVHGIDDVVDVAAWLSPDDPSRVVLVGVCSGAYHAIEAGIRLRAEMVGLVNPILYFDPPELRSGEEIAAHRKAVQPLHGIVRAMRSSEFVVRFSRLRVIDRVRRSSRLARVVNDWAQPAWAILDRLGIVRLGVRPLEALAAGGTETLLICGEREARTFRRSRRRLRSLVDAGSLSFTVIKDLDHSLFRSSSRANVSAVLRAMLPTYAAARTIPETAKVSGSRFRLRTAASRSRAVDDASATGT